jgi:hypothetical protein
MVSITLADYTMIDDIRHSGRKLKGAAPGFLTARDRTRIGRIGRIFTDLRYLLNKMGPSHPEVRLLLKVELLFF